MWFHVARGIRDGDRPGRRTWQMIRVRLQIGGNGRNGDANGSAIYRPRPLVFAFSFLAHAAFGFGLLHTPPIRPAHNSPVLRYRVTMLPPEERKIVYYPPRHRLPDISPTEAQKGPSPRGRIQSPDTLIATSKRPNAGKQLIWLPAPEIKTPIERPLPNLIAVAPRQEVAPPPPRKVFTPPAPGSPPPSPAPLVDAPSLNLQVKQAPPAPSALQGNLQGVPKPAPRTFTPPPAPKLTYGEPAVISDAPPEIASAKTGAALGSAPGIPGANRRRFIPPPPSGTGTGSGPGAGPGAGSAVVEAPPEIQASAGTPGVNMAIVGLNPAAKLEGPLPQYSQPGNFSRAPNTGPPRGGVAGDGDLRVPGLTVRAGGPGAPEPAPPPPPVTTAPKKVVVFETRMLQSALLLSAPLRPAARTLPAAIEARFANRLVYTVVLEKPKLPEYSDDWVLWFAESEPQPGATPQMRAPVPFRKLEVAEQPPKRNGPRQDHRVRLAARINKEGKLEQVAALGSRASPLDKQAVEDLRKWEFRPALRNGQPVTVDVVLEIPLSLEAGAQ